MGFLVLFILDLVLSWPCARNRSCFSSVNFCILKLQLLKKYWTSTVTEFPSVPSGIGGFCWSFSILSSDVWAGLSSAKLRHVAKLCLSLSFTAWPAASVDKSNALFLLRANFNVLYSLWVKSNQIKF